MTDKAELLALAERCEAASGPDRELDADIEIAIHGFPEKQYEANPGWTRDRRAFVVQWIGCKYTASLDAAMTLVPEGWVLSMLSLNGSRTNWTAMCWTHNAWQELGEDAPAGEHPTPALALCAAALRALASKDQPSSREK